MSYDSVLSILVLKNFTSPKINFEQLIYLSNKESFFVNIGGSCDSLVDFITYPWIIIYMSIVFIFFKNIRMVYFLFLLILIFYYFFNYGTNNFFCHFQNIFECKPPLCTNRVYDFIIEREDYLFFIKCFPIN